jgi:NAD(P)H-nitrite reductase large subunit
VDNRCVSVNGKTYPYDGLLIANGSDPRRIKAAELELKNIFFMRTEPLCGKCWRAFVTSAKRSFSVAGWSALRPHTVCCAAVSS